MLMHFWPRPFNCRNKQEASSLVAVHCYKINIYLTKTSRIIYQNTGAGADNLFFLILFYEKNDKWWKIFTRATSSLRESNDTVFIIVETKAPNQISLYFTLRGILKRNFRDFSAQQKHREFGTAGLYRNSAACTVPVLACQLLSP